MCANIDGNLFKVAQKLHVNFKTVPREEAGAHKSQAVYIQRKMNFNFS